MGFLSLLFLVSSSVGQLAHQGFLCDNYCIDQVWDSATGAHKTGGVVGNGLATDGADLYSNPSAHTVACMLTESCQQSGYSLLQANSDGTYAVQYQLNANGNSLAIALLESSVRTNNYWVKIIGQVNSAGLLTVQQITEEPIPVPSTSAPSGRAAPLTSPWQVVIRMASTTSARQVVLRVVRANLTSAASAACSLPVPTSFLLSAQ